MCFQTFSIRCTRDIRSECMTHICLDDLQLKSKNFICHISIENPLHDLYEIFLNQKKKIHT